jgi:hypothetical protein
MDGNDRGKLDSEKQLPPESQTIEALSRLLGPMLNLTKDWPPVLAYGALFAMLIVALVFLHAAVPAQLFWLLSAVFCAVLVTFIFTDRGVRRQRRQSKDTRDSPPAYAVPHHAPFLHCVSGDFASEQIEIPMDGMYIGRDPSKVNLVLGSDEISSVHVRVWPEPGGSQVWLEDRNSLNGTYYLADGQAAQSQWVQLKGKVLLGRGARFRLGDNIAEFEIRTA